MIINVYSLNKAKQNLEKHHKNWISIRDKGYERIYKEIDEGENILKLYFDDITKYVVSHNLIHPIYHQIHQFREFIYFDEQMAKEILKFAKKIHKKGEQLNIHCYAGRSRSQAVGYVLNTYFNLYIENNIKDYVKNLRNNNQRFMPNPEVLQIMNKICF